ncbi:Hypothetical Protein FCC1311_113132, partial [Hondaea fermentalgiana]
CIALGSVVLDGCIEVTSLGVCHIAECSGKNLWRLSLRDLPLLREDSLEPIAKYCTGLRFLALDVNLLVKETLAKEKDSDYKFLSIEDTGLLIELLKCCSSLVTLKLSNVLDENFAGWEDFATNINPYLRTLSLAGAAKFNDAALKSLAKKARFLRELRLSGILSHVVALVDFVRRVRARMKLSVQEYEEWEDLTGTDLELERCNVIVKQANEILDRFKGKGWGRVRNYVRDAMPLLNELRNAPLADTESTPFLALPSFDIMSTRRLNLKIDFRWNIYEFICPDIFDDVYLAGESRSTAGESGMGTNTFQAAQLSAGTVSSQPKESVKTFRLTGTISKIWPITVRTPDTKASRLLERYWRIPPEARYFCWANPLTDLKAANLNWFKHQRYEDTTRRFLHYGGFLYFDANRHFVSASALTVGTTLSFNGPFKLNQKTVDKLEAEKRWHKVTIKNLQPKDAEKLEFCFVFHGEKVLAPDLRRHCPHGGYAYRFTLKDGRPQESYLYPLASAVDVFLRTEDAPDKDDYGDASDGHRTASDNHADASDGHREASDNHADASDYHEDDDFIA